MDEIALLTARPGDIIGLRKDGRPIRLQAGGAPEDDDADGGRTFTKVEFDAALTRERDKLYGRIEKAEKRVSEKDENFATMQAEVTRLKVESDARAKEDAKRQKAADDARKAAEDAELSAKELIDKRQAEWQQQQAEREQQWTGQLSAMQQQIAERDAILDREKQFQALRDYAQMRVGQERDNIEPNLIDLITGDSEAEIDASIEVMKTKSQAIVQSIQQFQVGTRAAMPGVNPTGFTPTGPIDMQGGVRQFSAQDIANMPMAEYAKMRGQLIKQDGSNRGLFG